MEQWSNGAIQREYGVCCRLRDQMMERREFQPEKLQPIIERIKLQPMIN